MRLVDLIINKFFVPIDSEIPKLIHGKGGGELFKQSWNKKWEEFFRDVKNPSAGQILDHMGKMRKAFGI